VIKLGIFEVSLLLLEEDVKAALKSREKDTIQGSQYDRDKLNEE